MNEEDIDHLFANFGRNGYLVSHRLDFVTISHSTPLSDHLVHFGGL
jgi:hypothetical protein